MNKKTLVLQFAICTLHFALFAFSGVADAADLYVQSVKAPILSAPSLGSPKLAEAKKGEPLKEMEKQGNWHKVSYKDKTGWVSRLLVGQRPPAAKVSVLESSGEKLETGARKRASAFTTAAAARGFAEERSRVSDKYKVDFAKVEHMEAVKVSDEEALAFLQEGVGK